MRHDMNCVLVYIRYRFWKTIGHRPRSNLQLHFRNLTRESRSSVSKRPLRMPTVISSIVLKLRLRDSITLPLCPLRIRLRAISSHGNLKCLAVPTQVLLTRQLPVVLIRIRAPRRRRPVLLLQIIKPDMSPAALCQAVDMRIERQRTDGRHQAEQ